MKTLNAKNLFHSRRMCILFDKTMEIIIFLIICFDRDVKSKRNYLLLFSHLQKHKVNGINITKV